MELQGRVGGTYNRTDLPVTKLLLNQGIQQEKKYRPTVLSYEIFRAQ